MTPDEIEKWLAEFDAASASEHAQREVTRIPAKYRPPLDPADIAKMRHMRREGFTITQIARAVKCTWGTAWKHSNISKA